jgi:hypothetical protein
MKQLFTCVTLSSCSSFASTARQIAILSTGRTGSTYLMQLLSLEDRAFVLTEPYFSLMSLSLQGYVFFRVRYFILNLTWLVDLWFCSSSAIVLPNAYEWIEIVWQNVFFLLICHSEAFPLPLPLPPPPACIIAFIKLCSLTCYPMA